MSIPKKSVLKEVFNYESSAIEYLYFKNILNKNPTCCGQKMVLYRRNTNRCSKCGDWQTIFKGSIFYNRRTQANKVLHIFYLFITKMPYTSILLQHGDIFSSKTISSMKKLYFEIISFDLYNMEPQACEEILLNLNDSSSVKKIGGCSIIVQIDESKFNSKSGKWVLGGVEKTAQRNMFMFLVDDRKDETILGIITRFVKPGSVIYTDLLKSYSGLRCLGYQHKTVDHKKQFKTSDGIDTNTIEGNWNSAKNRIKPASRRESDIQHYLDEYVWFRRHSSRLWDSLMLAILSYQIKKKAL